MSWRVMARNTRTGQRVQNHHLDGYKVTSRQEALREAQRLAEDQSQRTGQPWVPVIEQFVNSRGR